MKLRPTQMFVTPEQARTWLARMAPNRHVNENHVLTLFRAMQSGHFDGLNGETVKIDIRGRLQDGQHRLLALIRADQPVEMLVVFDVAESAFGSIDVGRRRTVADRLAAQGEKSVHALAAGLRWIWAYRQSAWKEASTQPPASSELQTLLDKEPSIRDSIPAVWDLKGVLQPGLAVALHYLCSQIDREHADAFFGKLVSGAGLAPTDPAYHLRERLLRNRADRAKLSPRHLLAMCIYAWNSSRRGEPMKMLKAWREEWPFPDLL